MCGTMPKHNKSRRSGEGKSRPDTPPTRAADRAQKSSGAGTLTFARRESPLPRRFVRGNLLEPGQRGQSKCLHRPALQTSTTCWRLPCELCSGETEPTSLQSIWISSNGSRSSLEWGGSLERGSRQPLACTIFQIVRLERGRGTCAACNSGSRGR